MLYMNKIAVSSLILASAFAAPVAQVVETVAVVSTVYVEAPAATVPAVPAVPAASVAAAAVTTQSSIPSSLTTSSSGKKHHGKGNGVPKLTTGRHGKRGLAYNDATLASPFLSSKVVSWGYNWASGSDGFTSELEFVPMLWGSSAGSWSSDATNAISAGSRHLLGFNEPDNAGQSNLSPQTAASLWKANMEPFYQKAWLGSPAVTNGGAPMGLTWLSQFFDACTDCHVHFIALHWYASCSDTQYFKDYFTQAHQQFPDHNIWITEFGTTDGDDDQVSAFLQDVLPWLDSQDWIHRYAYFMDAEGMLINNGGLSTSGQTYAG